MRRSLDMNSQKTTQLQSRLGTSQKDRPFSWFCFQNTLFMTLKQYQQRQVRVLQSLLATKAPENDSLDSFTGNMLGVVPVVWHDVKTCKSSTVKMPCRGRWPSGSPGTTVLPLGSSLHPAVKQGTAPQPSGRRCFRPCPPLLPGSLLLSLLQGEACAPLAPTFPQLLSQQSLAEQKLQRRLWLIKMLSREQIEMKVPGKRMQKS